MKFLHDILVVGALLAAGAALAAPKNIDDCEKIKEPMAYNECLASFGPTAGHTSATKSYGPASEGEQRAARKGRKGRKMGASGGAVRGGVHGRVHMEFTPGRR